MLLLLSSPLRLPVDDDDEEERVSVFPSHMHMRDDKVITNFLD
jgi:hypothetical protein